MTVRTVSALLHRLREGNYHFSLGPLQGKGPCKKGMEGSNNAAWSSEGDSRDGPKYGLALGKRGKGVPPGGAPFFLFGEFCGTFPRSSFIEGNRWEQH